MGNWIFAKLKTTGEEVRVRQEEAGGLFFLTDMGMRFSVYDLDFTNAVEGSVNEDLVTKFMMSMDANGIADHKAEIDEREYWRRLRGEIALEMLHDGHMKGVGMCADYGALAQRVRVYFDELYAQHVEFLEKGMGYGKDSY